MIAAAGILLLTGDLGAQDVNDAVTFEDLGFTQRLHTGARPAGLGGAYSSIGEDVHSLAYNPAGLAGVRRIDLSVGFQHQKNNLDSRFFGVDNDVDLTTSNLDYIAGAYPLPTYRGSFVVAAGAYRVYSSDLDLLNRGWNSSTSTTDDYRLQQSGSVYSYAVGFAVDLAPTVSGGATAFLMDGTIKALTQSSFEFPGPFVNGEFTGAALVDDAQVDLDGYGAAVGVQYHPTSMFHFGLSITTPVPINIKGDAVQEEVAYYENAPDTLVRSQFAIDTDYRVPFRVDAGASVTLMGLLVAVDIGYTDWSQSAVNGVQLKDTNLRSIFRDVLEVRAGAEFTFPGIPMRIRGGYAYEPFPLTYLQADRILNTEITEADVETERQLFALGAGALISNVLTIDVAYEQVVGQRVIQTLDEKREMRRILLSTAYRF